MTSLHIKDKPTSLIAPRLSPKGNGSFQRISHWSGLPCSGLSNTLFPSIGELTLIGWSIAASISIWSKIICMNQSTIESSGIFSSSG